MPAPSAFARRQFPGAAADTTISAGINNTDTSVSLASTSGWPTGAYTGGVLCELFSTTTGLTLEKVWGTDLTGSTLTIVRAADGSSATSHGAGTGIRPAAGAIDADEANKAAHETVGQVTTAGDMLVADGANSFTRLAIGASGRIPVSNGSAPVWVAVSGDVTITSGGVVAIGNSKITNAMMADDAVGLAELADITRGSIIVGGAANAPALLDANDSGKMLVGDGTDLKSVAMSGDATLAADGTLTLANNAVEQANIGDDAVGLPELAASAKPRYLVGPFTGTVGIGDGFLGIGGAATNYVAIEACAVIGASVALDSARTAGSATFDVQINGSTIGVTPTIDGTNTQFHRVTQAETADPVAAGDRIAVYYDTTSLAASSADFAAYVLLQAV